MKNIATIVIASAVALSAAAVSAGQINVMGGYDEVRYTKTYQMAPAASREAAYQLGLDKLRMLESKSPLQLSRMLPGNILENSVHIKDHGHVKVAEQLSADGVPEYVSWVSVPLHYQESNGDR